jgi:hypothetical protein
MVVTTITTLDIIHGPVFYLKHGISETGFCLRLQVELSQVGQTDRASIRLRTRETFYWAHLSRFRLKTETEASLRNVVF